MEGLRYNGGISGLVGTALFLRTESGQLLIKMSQIRAKLLCVQYTR